MTIKNTLVFAKVMHARQRPRRHVFRYSVYYLCFPISGLTKMATHFLSLERWNLFSFYQKDHGRRDGAPLEPWIRCILSEHGLTEADGEILLMTLPRILGYVFNPVSFWFCFDKSNGLRAVLSEVCNTFGEHHSYLSYHADHHVIEPHETLRAEKLFHVSPFLPVKGYYLFRFACDDNRISAHVDYFDAEGLMLATAVTGSRVALTPMHLLKCFFFYPLVTFKVIALIHYQAVRLLMKGARYHPKPTPPTIEVSR